MAAKVPHTRSVHQVKTRVLEINHLNRAAARALDLEWHPEEDDPDLYDDVSSSQEDEIPQTWLPSSVLGRRPPFPIPSSPPTPKPASKAPRRRATRRIDDSEEERRAEEEAQEARPEGAFELLKHTLIVHLVRPTVLDEESNASLFSTFEDLLTEIDDEQTRIPIGRVYLAHNDNGDIAMIANTPLHGDDRDCKASSDPKVLLYLDKIGRELASPWGETSGFTMDQRSYNRPQVYSQCSWLHALAHLSAPTHYHAYEPRRFHADVQAALVPSIHSSPEDATHALEFTIALSVCPLAFTVADSNTMAEAQRRLFIDLLPPPDVSSAFEKHGKQMSIPFFYDVLAPAESGGWLPGEEEILTQPPGLKLDLLPFQTRTVRWLLGREGVRVDGSSVVVASWRDKGKGRAQEEGSQEGASIEEIKMEDDSDDSNEERFTNGRAAGLSNLASAATSATGEDARVVIVPAEVDGASWAFESHSLPLPPPAFPLAELQPQDGAQDDESMSAEDEQKKIWFNRLDGMLYRTEEDVREARDSWDVNCQMGGMLCEEMGLGKTIEVIALLLLHQSPLSRRKIVDVESAEVTAARCRQVKTTLIVSPDSLITQWKDEIEGHAPGLRVLVYNGYKNLPFKVTTAAELERVEEERGTKVDVVRRGRRAVEVEEEPEDAQPGSKRKRGVAANKPPANTKEPLKKAEESDWWEYLDPIDGKGYDVVLCSYATLENDLKVARQPKQRSRRGNVEYGDNTKFRSPLVMVEWWRIAMDEVQLSGKPKIEEMVSLLPRINSLAVSGTPARATVGDLRPTLQFLRQFHLNYFQKILGPGMAGVFEKLFKVIATRTTKAKVQQELTIPPQTRYLVPIDLAAVEMAYYSTTFSRLLEDLQFDEFGNGFDLNLMMARGAVSTLRQIATHVQIGGLAHPRHAAGAPHAPERRLNLGGSLLTLDQVLLKMLESNASDLASAKRAQVAAQLDHAQLLIQKVKDDTRGQELTKEIRFAPLRLQGRDLLLEVLEKSTKEVEELTPEANVADTFEDDERSQDDEDLTEEERKQRHLRAQARLRLRDMRMIQHKAAFMLGDWCHVGQDEAKEQQYYDQAADIRKLLLARHHRVADKGIALLTKSLEKFKVAEKDVAFEAPELEKGIQTARTIDAVMDLLLLMEDNGKLLWEWRSKMMALLPTSVAEESLVDGEAGADGLEAYAAGTEIQVSIDAMLQAYLVAVGDRREILDGQRNQLSLLEVRTVKKRKRRDPNYALDVRGNAVDGDAVVGEEDLAKKLMAKRARYQLNPQIVHKGVQGRQPLKTRLQALMDISQTATQRLEVEVATRASATLRKIISEQTKVVETLTAEGRVLETAYNARVPYFKEQQQISDSVMDVELLSEFDWKRKCERAITQEHSAALKVGGLVSRGRFLKHMDSVNDGETTDDHSCAICLEVILKGVLFSCSHMLCSDCYHHLTKKQPNNVQCPTCRHPIHAQEVNRVILGKSKAKPDDKQKKVKKEVSSNPLTEADKDKGKARQMTAKDVERERMEKLNVMPLEERVEIMKEMILGDWGSKINFLVKHLLYLAKHDRGYKAIVFSAFPDGLSIIQRALASNGISHSVSSQKNIRTVAHDFKEDASKRVFLLHGEKESSGLTLTCAKYVFLLEPTVAPSFELQAVGRVDRMGQTQETKVFCLFSEHTIDSSIVLLQVLKGTSIYQKKQAGKSVTPFSIRMDDGKIEGAVKKKAGDFIAKAADIASLLFPEYHIFATHTLPTITSFSDSGTDDAEDDDEAASQGSAAAEVARYLQGIIAADAADQRAGPSGTSSS